jgi:hypothetical protein
LSDRSQRDAVHFGVDGGTRQAPVAQYLANLWERGTPAKQLASQSMT